MLTLIETCLGLQQKNWENEGRSRELVMLPSTTQHLDHKKVAKTHIPCQQVVKELILKSFLKGDKFLLSVTNYDER